MQPFLRIMPKMHRRVVVCSDELGKRASNHGIDESGMQVEMRGTTAKPRVGASVVGTPREKALSTSLRNSWENRSTRRLMFLRILFAFLPDNFSRGFLQPT